MKLFKQMTIGARNFKFKEKVTDLWLWTCPMGGPHDVSSRYFNCFETNSNNFNTKFVENSNKIVKNV